MWRGEQKRGKTQSKCVRSGPDYPFCWQSRAGRNERPVAQALHSSRFSVLFLAFLSLLGALRMRANGMEWEFGGGEQEDVNKLQLSCRRQLPSENWALRLGLKFAGSFTGW